MKHNATDKIQELHNFGEFGGVNPHLPFCKNNVRHL